MAHDVFVSYSSKDKTVADAVCATLEQRGIRCWIAPRDILPGTDWGEGIIDGIEGSRLMVLVFSSNANSSQQIKREVERAVAKGLPIVPIRIENVVPERSLEYFLSTPHWLDALTPPLEQHLNYIAETVQVLLDRPADGAVPTRPSRPMAAPIRNVPRKAPRQTKPLLIALAALVVVVGGFFAVKALSGGGDSPTVAGTTTAKGLDTQMVGSWTYSAGDGAGTTLKTASTVGAKGEYKSTIEVIETGLMQTTTEGTALTPTGQTGARADVPGFAPTAPPASLALYPIIPPGMWYEAQLIQGGYTVTQDMLNATGTKMTGLPSGTVGYSADIAVGGATWAVTFKYSSNVYTIHTQFESDGVFSAADGKWKMIPQGAARVSEGDYRFVDDDTVALTSAQSNLITGLIANAQWKRAK